MMRGKEEDDVNVSNLTLRDSKDHGVRGDSGASFHLDNVSVENSGTFCSQHLLNTASNNKVSNPTT